MLRIAFVLWQSCPLAPAGFCCARVVNGRYCIKHMISYYNDLTYKTEDRRIRIHNFSLQILAVSVAAEALLITSDKIKSNQLHRNILLHRIGYIPYIDL